MSQTELDQLLDQLGSEDARARRTAVKRLGELGRPEAIADLVNVYMKDPDSNVRKAAGDALRIFRRMEQRLSGEGEADVQQGADLTPILSKARLALIVVLALTVLINLVFIGASIGKSLSANAPTPTPLGPTARADLVAAFAKRINDAHDEDKALRQVFSTMQGMGQAGLDSALCQKLTGNTLTPVTLADIDSRTYPDLKRVNDLINAVVPKLFVLQGNYTALCALTDAQQFASKLKDFNPANQIIAADDINNKDLTAADAALQQAIQHPAPTVGPTATPTVPPTATTSPATPTPVVSLTPTPAALTPTTPPGAATGAASGTAAAGGTARATASATSALATTYNLTGLNLSALPSFTYIVQGSTSGTLLTGKTFAGRLDFRVQRQETPLAAEYDVTVSEGINTLTFFKSYLGSLYVPGTSAYVIANHLIYETGTVVNPTKPGQCRALNLTPDTLSLFSDVSFGDLSTLNLTLAGGQSVVNSTTSVHYTGSRTTGDNNQFQQTVSVYISVDNHIPVEITITTKLDPKAIQDPKVRQAVGLSNYTQSLTYDLTGQNVALDISAPSSCNGVQPK
ncbi:MAG TPA: HEAT repeat domain-containing protein [Aggregatilineales bacterium]|nr:HEAT repeat domain-containing protein [Aggregatilineales bacterium]